MAIIAEGAFLLALAMLWVVCNVLIIDVVRSSRQSWSEYVKDAQGSKIGQILMTLFYCGAAIVLATH